MIKCVGKRGDTLIEVMLAVGIFSMVAVAVVAVMSGGTSSAQTALETTLTREEIDAQAEALRFIHSAYIADKNSGTEGKFSNLWKEITGRAIELENRSDVESIVQYSPSSCQELYTNSNVSYQKAFVIDTKKLNNSSPSNIVVPSSSSGGKLREASTYPHLVYSNDNANLVDSNTSSSLSWAEGLYIVAVRDPESTLIVGSDKTSGKESAYFDFYIRSCWYGTGDQNPSTISTVMRLYDPDAIKQLGGYVLNFYDNDKLIEDDKIEKNPVFVRAGESFVLPHVDGVVCWSNTKPNVLNGRVCKIPGDTIEVPLDTFSRKTIPFYAIYNRDYIWVDVNIHILDPAHPSWASGISGGFNGIRVEVEIDGRAVDGSDNWLCTDDKLMIVQPPNKENGTKKCPKVQDPYDKTKEIELEHMKVTTDPGDFWRPVEKGSEVTIKITSSEYKYEHNSFSEFGIFCNRDEVTCEILENGVKVTFRAVQNLVENSYSAKPAIEVEPMWVKK